MMVNQDRITQFIHDASVPLHALRYQNRSQFSNWPRLTVERNWAAVVFLALIVALPFILGFEDFPVPGIYVTTVVWGSYILTIVAYLNGLDGYEWRYTRLGKKKYLRWAVFLQVFLVVINWASFGIVAAVFGAALGAIGSVIIALVWNRQFRIYIGIPYEEDMRMLNLVKAVVNGAKLFTDDPKELNEIRRQIVLELSRKSLFNDGAIFDSAFYDLLSRPEL